MANEMGNPENKNLNDQFDETQPFEFDLFHIGKINIQPRAQSTGGQPDATCRIGACDGLKKLCKLTAAAGALRHNRLKVGEKNNNRSPRVHACLEATLDKSRVG